MGAGTLLWANERVTLQPAAKELNYDKLQTTIAIVKTPSGNYNLLMMTLHVPNKLSTYDKETWIITIMENAQKRYTLPTLIHVDMNAKLSSMKLLI